MQPMRPRVTISYIFVATKGPAITSNSLKDYPAQVVNWAVGPEGISLAKGLNIFRGRTVLGGFENGKDGLLYTGTKKAIQEKVREIIADTGTHGLIIGADCTIPSDINHERIEWVREAAIL